MSIENYPNMPDVPELTEPVEAVNSLESLDEQAFAIARRAVEGFGADDTDAPLSPLEVAQIVGSIAEEVGKSRPLLMFTALQNAGASTGDTVVKDASREYRRLRISKGLHRQAGNIALRHS